MSFTAVVLQSCLNAFVLVANVSSNQKSSADIKIMSFANNEHYASAPLWAVEYALSVSR